MDWSIVIASGSLTAGTVGVLSFHSGQRKERKDARRQNAQRDVILWGLPGSAGVVHRPGIDERVHEMEVWRGDVSEFMGETREFIVRTDARTEQLLPNGGRSVADRVRRVDERLEIHLGDPSAHHPTPRTTAKVER